MASAPFSFDESTIAQAGGEILDAQPEVQPHAIEQHEAAQVEAESSAEKDANGVAFDPAIHSGTKLKDGSWRLRRTRAEGGSIVGRPRSRSVAPDPMAAELQTQAENAAKARAAGTVAAQCIFTTGRMLGGEEWNPRTEPYDENKVMSDAWGDYFVAKGINDFPPGVALTMVLISYAAPRFAMPETQTRASKFRAWFTAKMARRKVKREAKKRGISYEELCKELGMTP